MNLIIKKINIAIDGPAASGKSTTARAVAGKLGYLYFDTGAMYRAVTLQILKNNLDPHDQEAVAAMAEGLSIQLKPDPQKTIIFVNEQDVSEAIRTPEVTNHIQPVAANPALRSVMVSKQQQMAKDGGVVMDGRDIGTVVLPDAELKIFMVASAEARALRRLNEMLKNDIEADFQQVLKDILQRDHDDMNRSSGPLRQASDAVLIDTTGLSIEAQTALIYQKALAIIKASAKNR